MWLREKHTNGVCGREKNTKATVLPFRTPEMGKNQCDGAGWLNGATEESTIIVPLQREGQRSRGSKADGGCVHKVGCRQEQSGAPWTQEAVEHAMCHSRQAQLRILWDTVEQVCVPGQAENARTWLLWRWRATPASLSCKWPLWTEMVENRNTQMWARQARWGEYRWINLQGREKEKHRDMLHTSQLFSNSTAVCHHCDKWMGSCALLDASYCCFMPL